MLCFRVEDENGLEPKAREYGWNTSFATHVNASEADELIAQEIRRQINGSNDRSIFSCSKSLGVVLFKYNILSDNPLYLIPFDNCNIVIFDAMSKKGNLKPKCMPYDITDLDYPFSRQFGCKEIALKYYIIDVENGEILDKYLKRYTGKGKHPRAPVQKDSEIVIRHIVNELVVKNYISTVYLLYCLQYKTKFLYKNTVMESLLDLFGEFVDNEDELNALCLIAKYLYTNWNYEKEISDKLIWEKMDEARFFIGYDAYSIAWEIMEGEYHMAWNHSSHYLLDEMLERIWYLWDDTR